MYVKGRRPPQATRRAIGTAVRRQASCRRRCPTPRHGADRLILKLPCGDTNISLTRVAPETRTKRSSMPYFAISRSKTAALSAPRSPPQAIRCCARSRRTPSACLPFASARDLTASQRATFRPLPPGANVSTASLMMQPSDGQASSRTVASIAGERQTHRNLTTPPPFRNEA